MTSLTASGRLRASGVRYVAAVALLLASLTTTAAAHQAPVRQHQRLSLVSSAQPSEADPVVADQAYRARLAVGLDVAVNAVATASATCRGCQAVARTVQVVDARWARHLRADNVATAWSRCRGCGGHVLSVQVVLTREAVDLTLNNRALGMNVSCTRCDTTAAAYQVVVSTRGRVDVDDLRDEVVGWVEAATPPGVGGAGPQALAPRSPGPTARGPAPLSGAGAGDRLGQLEQLAAGRTGGRVLRGAVQVRGGS